MKTTLDLPEELIREVKLRAVHQRRTVKDIVAEFIREGLGMAPLGQGKKRPASSRVEIGENGVPLFRCAPDAPVTRMTIEELLAFEQESQTEEDLKRAGLSL